MLRGVDQEAHPVAHSVVVGAARAATGLWGLGVMLRDPLMLGGSAIVMSIVAPFLAPSLRDYARTTRNVTGATGAVLLTYGLVAQDPLSVVAATLPSVTAVGIACNDAFRPRRPE